MADDGKEGPRSPPTSSPTTGGMAQVDPDAAARYHEADTRHMLNELTGEISTLKDRLARIDSRADADSRRLDDLARKSDDIIGRLSELSPKIDDVTGFIKHGVPTLAKKDDLTAIKLDMQQRPTRRQSIFDLIAFIGLIGAIVALAVRYAK